MNQVQNLKKLENLSYFGKNTLSQYLELSENSLYANIKRWIKNRKLIQLKKGLYVTSTYYTKITDKSAYTEFIANKLRFPSYLSLEYILQKHSILSEAVYSVTSITVKAKRTYSNPLGIFVYRNIKEALFTGYHIKKYGQFEIKEATKAKALFDYLYLKTYRTKDLNQRFLASLRLNLDELAKKDLEEFSTYCAKTSISKFKRLPALIRNVRNS